MGATESRPRMSGSVKQAKRSAQKRCRTPEELAADLEAFYTDEIAGNAVVQEVLGRYFAYDDVPNEEPSSLRAVKAATKRMELADEVFDELWAALRKLHKYARSRRAPGREPLSRLLKRKEGTLCFVYDRFGKAMLEEFERPHSAEAPRNHRRRLIAHFSHPTPSGWVMRLTNRELALISLVHDAPRELLELEQGRFRTCTANTIIEAEAGRFRRMLNDSGIEALKSR
jgi:hypothetical protein